VAHLRFVQSLPWCKLPHIRAGKLLRLTFGLAPDYWRTLKCTGDRFLASEAGGCNGACNGRSERALGAARLYGRQLRGYGQDDTPSLLKISCTTGGSFAGVVGFDVHSNAQCAVSVFCISVRWWVLMFKQTSNMKVKLAEVSCHNQG